MPEPMLLHPLAPDVKCPACGAALAFIRVRRYGDLYQCSDGPCRREVLHYRSKGTKACGYALAYGSGQFGAWTACGREAGGEGGVIGHRRRLLAPPLQWTPRPQGRGNYRS